MDDGTPSGVQTPSQPGVIERGGENLPHIPLGLLLSSIEELKAKRERLSHALSLETQSVLPNPGAEERFGNIIFVYDAAIAAVERQQEASVQR